MIRKESELRVSITQNAKNGKGEFVNHHILEKEEFCGNGRYYAKCHLAPGHSVGSHVHTGEMEICHFISGFGVVVEDGVEKAVGPGDTNIVWDGGNHEVINRGNEDLVYTAIIIYHSIPD